MIIANAALPCFSLSPGFLQNINESCDLRKPQRFFLAENIGFSCERLPVFKHTGLDNSIEVIKADLWQESKADAALYQIQTG